MCVLEIEPHFSNRDDSCVCSELAQRIYVRLGEFGWVVPDAGEDLLMALGEVNRMPAVLEVDAHPDDASYAGGDRLLHHLVGMA